MYRPKLFAGIELDERTRRECAAIAARLEVQGVPGRFEPAEKLHVTLAFLGWVDPEQLGTVGEVLQNVASRCPAFTLSLDKLGAFPHERRPRVIWIGAKGQTEGFRELARTMRAEYSTIGFNFDKDALAHITIARVKDGHAHLPPIEVKPMRLRVQEITLFESLPAGRSTRYEVRLRARLQGRPARV